MVSFLFCTAQNVVGEKLTRDNTLFFLIWVFLESVLVYCFKGCLFKKDKKKLSSSDSKLNMVVIIDRTKTSSIHLGIIYKCSVSEADWKIRVSLNRHHSILLHIFTHIRLILN